MKIFSQFVGCLLTVSFALQKLFNFMKFHLSIVDLRASAIGVLLRKISPVTMWLRLFPTLPSIRLSASVFMLRCLIYIDWNFVQGGKCGSICIPLHGDCQLDQHHLLKMLPPPTISLWLLCQRSSVHRCGNLCLHLWFSSTDQPFSVPLSHIF